LSQAQLGIPYQIKPEEGSKTNWPGKSTALGSLYIREESTIESSTNTDAYRTRDTNTRDGPPYRCTDPFDVRAQPTEGTRGNTLR